MSASCFARLIRAGVLPPLVTLLALLLSTAGCSGDGGAGPEDDEGYPDVDRYAAIPGDVVKGTPETDPSPPILHSPDFTDPAPLPQPVNSAGSEDAPFIPAADDALFFFFAADLRDDASLQIQNPVNGIWVARRNGTGWAEPSLVWLQDPGVPALNGCPFVSGDGMLFCTIREGFPELGWFEADKEAGSWENWRPASFPQALEVGELHVHDDELYYDSSRPGGEGGRDIWRASRSGDTWVSPENVEAVNTHADETRPYVSGDGSELWITRTYQGSPAVFRSLRVEGAWQEAELVVSRFAGEPTLDSAGNLYFVHHFMRDGAMVEADIYVAYRR